MKIFIKNTPVTILSRMEFIRTSDYDYVYDGTSVKRKFDKWSGEILIKDAPVELIDDFLVYLKQNGTQPKIEGITFTVDDYTGVIRDIKKEYTIIKAAGGLVLKDGKVLMIWRLKKWDLPKGKLDKGEKIRATAVREVEEECNVKVQIGKKICHTWHTYKRNGKKILKKTYWYKMYCVDDSEMKPQKEENIEDIRWMGEEELKEALYNTYPSIRDVFRHYSLMD